MTPQAARPAYASFSFPLNVYSHLLTLQEGALDYLHYGLHATPDTPFTAAQQHSTAQVLARLPAAPARILEVGIGVGTLFRQLSAQGYAMVGITPDAAQIAYARAQCPPGADLRCTRLEDLQPDAEAFDLVLFQESAQYIPAIDLFSQCARLLKPGGQVLVLDELIEWRDPEQTDYLPYRPQFLAQAERQGFVLAEEIDLSGQAAPTVDYILRHVEGWRARLCQDLALDDARIDALLSGTAHYQREYRRGRYRYRLLQFRIAGVPRWRPARLTAADRPAVQHLFQATFGHPLSDALWHWKYAEGRGQETGIWEGNELVAHYGGFTRRVRMDGETCFACQMGDSMVKTATRGVLTRKGPFYLAMTSHVEQWCGWGNLHRLAFGFPNARAMAVGERLGLYGDVGRLSSVSWPATAASSDPALALSPITGQHPQFDALAELLWANMAADLPQAIIGVRDAAWLRQRYLAHPHHPYQLWLVYRTAGPQPMGIAVVKPEGPRFELLDVVGPLAALGDVLRMVRSEVARQGGSELYCWISEPYSAHFVATGGSASDPDVHIPCNLWGDNNPAPETLRNRWWLMGGDTDFR